MFFYKTFFAVNVDQFVLILFTAMIFMRLEDQPHEIEPMVILTSVDITKNILLIFYAAGTKMSRTVAFSRDVLGAPDVDIQVRIL